MKSRRAIPVGSGYRSAGYRNHEGYPDPTAGCVLAECENIGMAIFERQSKGKRKTIRRRIHPISEMAKDLEALGV